MNELSELEPLKVVCNFQSGFCTLGEEEGRMLIISGDVQYSIPLVLFSILTNPYLEKVKILDTETYDMFWGRIFSMLTEVFVFDCVNRFGLKTVKPLHIYALQKNGTDDVLLLFAEQVHEHGWQHTSWLHKTTINEHDFNKLFTVADPLNPPPEPTPGTHPRNPIKTPRFLPHQN